MVESLRWLTKLVPLALIFVASPHGASSVSIRGSHRPVPSRFLHYRRTANSTGIGSSSSPSQPFPSGPAAHGQLTFVHIPKCAGTTVEQTLKRAGYLVGRETWRAAAGVAEEDGQSDPRPAYWERIQFNVAQARKTFRLPSCEDLFTPNLCKESRWSHSQPGVRALSFCSGCPMWHAPPVLLFDGNYTSVAGVRGEPGGMYDRQPGMTRDYFVAIKDPLERAVSEYRFQNCPGDINTFIQSRILTLLASDMCADDCHWLPQATYIVPDKVQHLMAIEHLDAGLNHLVSLYGVGNSTQMKIHNRHMHLGHNLCSFPVTASSASLVDGLLDDSTKKLLTRLYRSDLELHNSLLEKREPLASFGNGSRALAELAPRDFFGGEEENGEEDERISSIDMPVYLTLVVPPKLQQIQVVSKDIHSWGKEMEQNNVAVNNDDYLSQPLTLDPRPLHALLELPACGGEKEEDWTTCLDTSASKTVHGLRCSGCNMSHVPPFLLQGAYVKPILKHYTQAPNVWEEYVTVISHPFEEVVNQYVQQNCTGEINSFVRKILWTMLTDDMCYAECHLLPQISYTLLTRKHSVILKDRLKAGLKELLRSRNLKQRFRINMHAAPVGNSSFAGKQTCPFPASMPVAQIIETQLTEPTKKLLERVYHQDLKLFELLSSTKDTVVTFRHGEGTIDGRVVHLASLLKLNGIRDE